MVHTTTPGLHLLPQRGPIADAALSQALPGKQANRDLGLIQPNCRVWVCSAE